MKYNGKIKNSLKQPIIPCHIGFHNKPKYPPSNTASFGHPGKSYLTSHFSTFSAQVIKRCNKPSAAWKYVNMYDTVSYSFLTNFREHIIKTDAVWTVSVPIGVVTVSVSVLLYSASRFYSLLLKSSNFQRKEVHDGRPTRMALNKNRGLPSVLTHMHMHAPWEINKNVHVLSFLCFALCAFSPLYCLLFCFPSWVPPHMLCITIVSSFPGLLCSFPSPVLQHLLPLHPFPASV